MEAKNAIRKELREKLSAMSIADYHSKSLAACSLLAAADQFNQARVVMLYLTMQQELDTSSLALRCWNSSGFRAGWGSKSRSSRRFRCLTTIFRSICWSPIEASAASHRIELPMVSSPLSVVSCRKKLRTTDH